MIAHAFQERAACSSFDLDLLGSHSSDVAGLTLSMQKSIQEHKVQILDVP